MNQTINKFNFPDFMPRWKIKPFFIS